MGSGALSHLALTISDIGKAESFYGPILEFMGYTRGEVPEHVQRLMKTKLIAWGGLAGSVTLRPAKAGLGSIKHNRDAPGLNHFAFRAERREDVDAMAELLHRIGANILDEPSNYDYMPDYYAVYFADPDGIKFEYVHAPALHT